MPTFTSPDSQPRYQQFLLCFYFCFSVSQRLRFPIAPGSLILVICQSCQSLLCLQSTPYFLNLPDYFLASVQAISSAFLNNPFSSVEPQGNFLPLWNAPSHSSPQSSLYLGIDHHHTQRKKLKYLCIRNKGTKGLFIHLTNICWASPVFQYSTSCWDTIMSKTHMVPGPRESVCLHILDNRNTKYGDISNIK